MPRMRVHLDRTRCISEVQTSTHHIEKREGKWYAASLRAAMDTLPNGEYEVKLSSATRMSKPQRGYLHVLFGIIADILNRMDLGDGRRWTKEKVKHYAKAVGIYPTEEMVLPDGEIVEVPVDTRALDRHQSSEVIERLIQHFWEEFKIRLPGPNEQVEIDV